MGTEHGAICNSCGHKFRAREGPSMIRELLHCERCGGERWISLLDVPFRSDDKETEELAGRCACGGQYKVHARARCPRCKSSDWREDPEELALFYD
ncbi:MAG: hypothetical protein LUP95_04910 [Euryarchaeota archaeon]|nr:hypothetical protein [Euryarchaeota archaeon]